MMRNKKSNSVTYNAESQLQNLREENYKLRDSLMLQRMALDQERKEKEDYIIKYHKLEKEKKEAIERYQNLLLKLVQSNVLSDENPFAKVLADSPTKIGQIPKEQREYGQKSSRTRSNVTQEDSVHQHNMLSRLLQYNVSLEKTHQKLAELKLEPGKLITLREVNGSSVEFRQSKEKTKRESSGSGSQRRLSYFQKLKLSNQ